MSRAHSPEITLTEAEFRERYVWTSCIFNYKPLTHG